MKKKLLLIALPIFMALPGCARVNNAAPQKQLDPLEGMVEDTLAHEEIFGAAQAKDPSIRRMETVDIDDYGKYKVGYQLHFDDKGTVDTEDDVISYRFIAAIDADYTTMRWTRAVAGPAGQEVRTLSDQHHDKKTDEDVYNESHVVYDHLANGAGNDVMTAGAGFYEDYTGFIIYSLLNIPYEDNKDNYIGVTLALDEIHTDFYAVKIEKNGAGTASAHSFSFASNKNGFFLLGTVDGSSDRVVDADATTKDSENNAASFTSYFAANDNFFVVQKTAEHFLMWKGGCLQDEDANVEDDDGLIKINTAARHAFYLNKTNQLYHTTYTGYPGEWDFHVRGPASTGSWDSIAAENDAFRLHADPDNKGFIRVALNTGDFKLTHRSDWTDAKGWSDRVDGASGSAIDGTHIVEGADGNFNCAVAGTYDIYLNNEWKVHFVFVA